MITGAFLNYLRSPVLEIQKVETYKTVILPVVL
jgi:hypothetical protein